eukprot:3279336-Alexandrium_andersonii.AAC.1
MENVAALAAEANRTLAQARAAVAAARAARDYYPIKGKDKKGKGHRSYWQDWYYPDANYYGKGYSDGKNKGKHKGKDKNDFKGKDKGDFKGKAKDRGKGKQPWGKSYWHESWWDPEQELYTFSQDILALESDTINTSMAEAVLDTGATQTAGGEPIVQKICEVMKKHDPKVKPRRNYQDRPWFRFGNG